MTAPGTDIDVKALQRRAELALRAARPREQVVRLLEQLAEAAEEDSAEACFAHRHLAELQLEENPWGAALHLRRVLRATPDDDIAQALMGLCQALQGNFRMAVAAYRRAVALVPSNPWYNHNLGHLLDVALGLSTEALTYLRRAHRAQPQQEEVGASLAHCLGRTGRCAEGLELARTLARKHPRHKDLKALIAWLEQGAPPRGDGLPGLPASRAPGNPPGRRGEAGGSDATLAAPGSEVERAIVEAMARGGHASSQIDRACALWRDYAAQTPSSSGTAAALAAAVEYALARIDGAATRQRDVAARHGVSVSALSTRYASLRTRLKLVPGDARYASPPSR